MNLLPEYAHISPEMETYLARTSVSSENSARTHAQVTEQATPEIEYEPECLYFESGSALRGPSWWASALPDHPINKMLR